MRVQICQYEFLIEKETHIDIIDFILAICKKYLSKKAAYMAETSYNELKSGKREGMIRISSGDILDKKYLSSNEMRKQVAAAKKVIATSEKQGRLSFMHGTAYVEDMFDQLQAQKIQTEKERLLSLDDKGLMVELILAMRGLYAQIEDIQFQQITLTSRIEDIESDISSIRSDISDLESRLGSSDQ